MAKDKSQTVPGLLHSLERMINIKGSEYQELIRKVSGNPKLGANMDRVKEMVLNPQFLHILLFHSDERYVDLAKNGACHFYALIENNLLTINQKPLDNLVVDFLDDRNKWETALISKEDFLKFVYLQQCISNKEIQTLFSFNNFENLIKKINFPVPKKERECTEILDSWKQNIYTPYLCRISEVFQTAKKYLKVMPTLPPARYEEKRKYQEFIRFAEGVRGRLSVFQYTYINNLCQNLSHEDDFCDKYLSDSFWDKVINGERSFDYMKYRCRTVLRKENLNRADYEKCRESLESYPQDCHYMNNNLYPALVPKLSCHSISKALRNSHLKSNYQDCPSLINNEGLVNTSRIISHLENKVIQSTPSNCNSSAAAAFSKLVFDFGQDSIWGYRLCYYDRLEEAEQCFPMILGDLPDNELSESKVMAKIMVKSKGAPENVRCTIVKRRDYRPYMLEYKKGCYLVYDEDFCTSMECPKEIYLNEKKITDVKYDLGTSFNYFPPTISEEQYAISNIMKKMYHYKTQLVRNLSELKEHFDKDPAAIIHGEGCVEDLLPTFFRKQMLNECRPVPFIIDGYFQENASTFLILRTALDENQSPRIVTWNYLFSAVKNAMELHPLKTWNLYVIK